MASSLGTTHPCVTSPFWYENLDGYGFQNVLDVFSTQSARNLTSFLAFKFLNGEASKFLYDYGSSERTEHRNVQIFNQSRFRGLVLRLRSLNRLVRMGNYLRRRFCLLFVCFSRCISNCGAKVSPQDGLSLEAICYGELCKKTSSYKWSLHLVSFSRDTFSILDVSDAAVKPSKSKNHVLINISKLHRDTARKRLYYLVKAVIHLDDHIEVEGNFSFVVNSPPQRMTSEAFCDVNPSEGEAVSTHFRIRCLGWYDEDQPLTYLFRYGGKHDMIVIQTGQLNNISTKLPIGAPDKDYTLVLEALVGDSFKDFTITTLTVKVGNFCGPLHIIVEYVWTCFTEYNYSFFN